jgi:sigma-B regulation protein RsbU (phosphoserine phosphatase)
MCPRISRRLRPAPGRRRFDRLHIQRCIRGTARATGRDSVETDGVWLGVVADIDGHLQDHRLELAPGDTLLLFSDGVTEAVRDGKTLDTEGLSELLAREVSAGVDGLSRRLLASMTGYRVDDDMTVVAVCRTA